MDEETKREALADLGRYLRAQREISHLSIRHLARLAKVSDSYLSQVERGRYQPSAEFLANIAKGLSISPDELFRMSGWLPDSGSSSESEGPSVIDAISRDARLTSAQQSALVQLYRSMVGDD